MVEIPFNSSDARKWFLLTVTFINPRAFVRANKFQFHKHRNRLRVTRNLVHRDILAYSAGFPCQDENHPRSKSYFNGSCNINQVRSTKIDCLGISIYNREPFGSWPRPLVLRSPCMIELSKIYQDRLSWEKMRSSASPFMLISASPFTEHRKMQNTKRKNARNANEFFEQNCKKPKIEIFAFCVITFGPIRF